MKKIIFSSLIFSSLLFISSVMAGPGDMSPAERRHNALIELLVEINNNLKIIKDTLKINKNRLDQENLAKEAKNDHDVKTHH